MSRETHTPFIIDTSADFLTQHPHLGSLGSQLSIRYIHKEVVTDAHLKQLGQGLWAALSIAEPLEEAWSQARPRVLPIVVRSDDPAILNLPWECLHHPEEGFLGRHEGFTLSRQLKTGTAGEAALPKGAAQRAPVHLFAGRSGREGAAGHRGGAGERAGSPGSLDS